MARFTLPRDLYHGKGALENLKNLTGKRAIVVVGGGSMKRFGSVSYTHLDVYKRQDLCRLLLRVHGRRSDPLLLIWDSGQKN